MPVLVARSDINNDMQLPNAVQGAVPNKEEKKLYSPGVPDCAPRLEESAGE